MLLDPNHRILSTFLPPPLSITPCLLSSPQILPADLAVARLSSLLLFAPPRQLLQTLQLRTTMATTTAPLPEARSMPSPLAHLLKSYTSSHPLRSPSPLPPNSRVDPQRTQRSPPPTSASPLLWTIGVWIAFAQFALAKGLHIIWSLLKHLLVGPRRKSWGYRMTFVSESRSSRQQRD